MRKLFPFYFQILLLLPSIGLSQAPPPIGTMPMLYNGSFAGSVGNSRLSTLMGFYSENTNYTDEHYFSLKTSFDRFYPAISTGIGFSVSSLVLDERRSGDDWYYEEKGVYSSIAMHLAPKISVKGQFTFSPSISVSYYGNHVNVAENFEGWDPALENGYQDGMVSHLGLLLNSDKYYIGCSLPLFRTTFDNFHWMLLQPNIQFGYTFQRSDESKFSFTPQLMVGFGEIGEAQSLIVADYVMYNLGFRYQQFLASIIGHELIPSGIQLGWQKDKWRIITTHEFYVNNYQPTLSFRYIFNHGKHSIHIYDQNF